MPSAWDDCDWRACYTRPMNTGSAFEKDGRSA